MSPLCVLLVGDNPDDRDRAARALERELECEICSATTLQELEAALDGERVDAVVTDFHLGWGDGIEVLRAVRARFPDLPVVMFTGTWTEEVAIEAMKLGLDDYVIKSPSNNAQLPFAVDSALRRRADRQAADHTARELERAEARFHELVEQLPAVVYDAELGEKGRFHYVSRRIHDLLGYTVEEWLDDPELWYRCIHPEDRERALREEWETTHANWLDGEYRMVRRDGDVVWVRDRGVLVDSDGGPTLVQGVFFDITELKRTEQALRDQRDRAQRYLDLAQVMLVGWDLEGRVTLLNRAAAEVLGCSEEEALGTDWFERFVPERMSAQLRERFAGTLSRPPGPHIPDESAVLTASGEERLIRWLGAHVRDASGSLVGSIASGTDVTEQTAAETKREALEAQLRQSQKMDAVGQLAGGIAHDFNNLLAVILNYGQLVHQSLGENDPRREDVHEIVASAERAATLVRQLLTFSRKEIVAPEVADLNRIVLNVERLLRRTIGEDIELDLDLANGLPSVLVDVGQAEQVLMNLAVNARDAMPGGGIITISTRLVDLGEATAERRPEMSAGAYVAIRVADNGEGMSEEVVGRIFEPFFTTKARDVGTGLGLATVYGIVKRAGGFIYADSDVGRGTTFDVYLPRDARSAHAEGAGDVEPLAPGAGRTVLVTEDEAAVRRVVCRLLEQGGYGILSAASGEEALELARAHDGPLDALLTDVVMPGMSGRALSEAIAELRPGVRTLYMSGYTDEIVAARGELEPGEYLVQKPFTGEVLLRRLAELLAV